MTPHVNRRGSINKRARRQLRISCWHLDRHLRGRGTCHEVRGRRGALPPLKAGLRWTAGGRIRSLLRPRSGRPPGAPAERQRSRGAERSAEPRIAAGPSRLDPSAGVQPAAGTGPSRSGLARSGPAAVQAATAMRAAQPHGSVAGGGIFVRRPPCEIPPEHSPKCAALGKCAGPRQSTTALCGNSVASTRRSWERRFPASGLQSLQGGVHSMVARISSPSCRKMLVSDREMKLLMTTSLPAHQ